MALLAGLSVAALVGCERDEVRRYRVAKAGPAAGSAEASHPEPQRLLAAIINPGDRTWFFKLSGPVADVSEHARQFSDFIQSVSFENATDAEPVRWQLPEGWHREPGGGPMRYATIHVDAQHKLELTVTFLGGQAGGVLANVNRWRTQIGLQHLAESQLPQVVREVEQRGQKVSLVDMVGPGAAKGAGGMMPPFAGGAAGDAEQPAASPRPGAVPPLLARPEGGEDAAPQIRYTTPEGWRSLPASGMRVAAFMAGPENAPAQVTVIPLSGAVGGTLANVNRWRNQIGLGPIDEAGLAKLIRTIEIDGSKAAYVSLVGPEEASPRIGMLAAMLERDGRIWFFKMTGPFATVERQTPQFEAFVRSVHFAGSSAR